MAFTLRNSTRLVDSKSKVENKNGFNQFSAPGPHQGQGGQSVSLEDAEKKFAERSHSPLKRDVPLEHAEYHFSKRAGSVAKKCSPITMKASPLKMNEALVQGAADSSKRFVDISSSMGEGIARGQQVDVKVNKRKKPSSVEDQGEETNKEQ